MAGAGAGTRSPRSASAVQLAGGYWARRSNSETGSGLAPLNRSGMHVARSAHAAEVATARGRTSRRARSHRVGVCGRWHPVGDRDAPGTCGRRGAATHAAGQASSEDEARQPAVGRQHGRRVRCVLRAATSSVAPSRGGQAASRHRSWVSHRSQSRCEVRRASARRGCWRRGRTISQGPRIGAPRPAAGGRAPPSSQQPRHVPHGTTCRRRARVHGGGEQIGQARREADADQHGRGRSGQTLQRRDVAGSRPDVDERRTGWRPRPGRAQAPPGRPR